MKVQELLTNVQNKDFNLEKELQVKKYLPIDLKKTIAKGIIYETANEENGVIQIDSVQKYLSYVRYMITTHTNLEYIDDDYDALCSAEYNGESLLDAIMKCFEHDEKECSKFLNFMIDDYIKESSLEYSIAKFLNGLTNSINDIVEKVGGTNIEDVIPDNLDMEKLSVFLNNYTNRG